MSVEVHLVNGFGLIKTEKQFILIFKGNIFGPYRNEHIRRIVEVLENTEGE